MIYITKNIIKSLSDTAYNRVNKCAEDKDYSCLEEIITSDVLPGEIVERARIAFPFVVEDAIEKYTNEKNHKALLNITKDKLVPKNLRVRAGIELVNIYGRIRKSQYYLKKIVNTMDVSKEVRDKAKEKIYRW